MSSFNWLDKYKPTSLSQVIGNKDQIQTINNFIKSFKGGKDNIHNPNLIITGTNGIGKSLIVDLAIKENNLEKITPILSNISITRKKKKDDGSGSACSNRSAQTYYMTLMNNGKLLFKKKYDGIALVVDNISTISNLKEKEAIKALIKINNVHKKYPIIIIGNTKHSKIVNELKKMVSYNIKSVTPEGKKETKKFVNEILLHAPQYEEMRYLANTICTQEKIKIAPCKNNYYNFFEELVLHSQYDVRRMINILEELKIIFKNAVITEDKFLQYQETSKTKDIDPGIYEATRTLLNNYTTMENALLIYAEERATIPLMVHENYPLNIRQQYPKISPKEQIDMIYDISQSISESDRVDGLIYSNQCWSLQTVHGFYSCTLPSYYVNSHPNKLCKYEKYKYTQDYNKTSIKKINNKVIKKAQEHSMLKNLSVEDFLYIASILKNLMERKDYQTLVDLMKPYKLSLKEIESIIKIDKITKNKITLTSKQKKILEALLEEE